MAAANTSLGDLRTWTYHVNPGSRKYEVGVINHQPRRLLGLSSVLNGGVTYLKWPLHSSVVLSAAVSRFKRVLCVRGSRKEFQSKGFSNGMFGRDDRRSCHGYGVVVVATRAREILLAGLSVWSIASVGCCWTEVRGTSSLRLWFTIRNNYE